MGREPWSDIGRLQSDFRNLEQQLRNKADDYEVHATNSKVAHLERALRELSTTFDELRYRLEDAENKIIELQQENEE